MNLTILILMLSIGIVFALKQNQRSNHEDYIRRIRRCEIDYYKYLIEKYGQGEFIYDEKE